MQEPLLLSSSQAQNKPKIQKLKYFYQASVFSKLLFSWITVLIAYGNKNELKQENLQDLKMHDRAELIYQDWAIIWNSEKNKEGALTPLKDSIKKAFSKRFIWAIFLDFFAYALTIATPVLIYVISLYLVNYEHKTTGQGFMWLAIVSVVRFFRSFFDGHANYSFTVLGADIGNTLALGMVKKSLNYSVLCNKNFKMGQLANLLQVDCFRLAQFPKNFSSVIYIITVLVFGVGFMGYLVHISFLAGFGVIVVASIINMIVSRFTAKYQINIANQTDNRMKQTNEIFNNIKFIKVNAWEQYFYDKLEVTRSRQLNQYKSKFMIQTISTFSMWLTPKMILVATFGTFVAMGGQLTSPIAFAVVSLFAYVQFYLQFLPNSLSIVIESYNAVKRIQKFLLAEQINKSCISYSRYQTTQSKDAITVQNGNFFWDKSENTGLSISDNSTHLTDLNFSIRKGQMVAIVGGIGSGKSSLIYSLLGQMKYHQTRQRPKVTINGSLSLVTQKPWIVNDTVRNNIRFGKQYNKKKYQDVIHYASLKRDFQLFTHGDKTMIGQKGATLSGGQKARISFARALYSQSDILLLDDLLSAVDVHVGKFMMCQTLLKYAKDKTRILVTHALYYLKYVDKVILMEDGRIVQQGSYQKLKNSARFRQIYQNMMKDQKRKKSQPVVDLLQQIQQQIQKVQPIVDAPQQEKSIDQNLQKQRSTKVRTLSTSSHIQQKANKQQVNMKIQDPAVNQLMMAQQSTADSAGFTLYRSYAKYNGGWIWTILICICMFAWLLFNTAFNIWLSVWTGDTQGNHPDSYYLSYYVTLGCLYGLFSFFRALILAISNPRMSYVVHESMISNLLFSSLNQFFDRVPLGRILNRLSKDLNTIDANLPVYFANVQVFLFFLIGNIIIIIYCTTFWVAFPILAYLLGIYFLQGYYMKPNKALVRMQGVTKSPIISCFSQILSGVATIRSYNAQNMFFIRNCAKINQNKKPQIAKKAGQVWFTIRLTFLSFIINVSALSFVLFLDIPDTSQACLLLVVSLSFDEITYFFITNYSNFQNQLISLERCQTFMKLTPQRGYQEYLKNRQVFKIKSRERRKQGGGKSASWPDKGQIKFIDFKVKYRPNLDLVLRGLTVTFIGGEKIGVVGRTGSGKSTIMMCLLRILEAYSGQIILDGKDISKLSLDDLRSKITIILQDPCLFAGDLRTNLDPLEQYTDDQLNHALQVCALKQVMDQRNGLLTQITENGQNLSVGERQLVSIARAILKPTKIVLVDQATANIDVKTQSVIYKAMNESFKNSTVITIAHRLNTVINSDKILVLQGGLLKQYDNPQILLRNPNSFFAQLYNESQKESKM